MKPRRRSDNVRRILMVGQERSLAWQIESMLTNNGRYLIYLECDNSEMSVVMSQLNPDLLLIDMDMPELDHKRVLEDHVGDADARNIPVLLISSLMCWNSVMPIAQGDSYPLLSKKAGASALARQIHEKMAI
ncbi:MAG: hypothetical protein OET90_00630 [Desulfuromonadales bacterium]|nr:hypothetical protein [Desulfuromonadales bacterium]